MFGTTQTQDGSTVIRQSSKKRLPTLWWLETNTNSVTSLRKNSGPQPSDSAPLWEPQTAKNTLKKAALNYYTDFFLFYSKIKKKLEKT